MSRLVEIHKDISEARAKISENMRKKEAAEKELEEYLGDFFPTHVKKLIDKKLMENFSEKHLKKIQEDREGKNKQEIKSSWASIDGDKYNFGSATSYCASTTFDPENDKYKITNVNVEDGMVMIEVECTKNRNYLGIDTWFPDIYRTKPFSIKELEAEEEKMI